ncbi:MAG: isoleucine--tRNA ligase [Oscillospiraceae bacterium]|jgi:isoleucyl-tRNA synthetase|nr:isoleucine--tRNA ligase [Oscillospiraceae bacterium]
MPDKTDYNATLNLPKTDFPMRAGLAKREPAMLADFTERRIYDRIMERNAGKPPFVLHDGPPFSNGDIHIGTAMNKILKDIIVRHRNMTGWYSPYVPGWDNHGLPIESAIIKKTKLDRKSLSVAEFRNACHAYATDYVERQMAQFVRLGVLGDWDHPYLTMDPRFEAEEVRVFGAMYEKGYIYKGLKPVYWCPSDETALAEAEIEYADDPCDAIYVKFAATSYENTYYVIWTTTTWTLPGNLAICLNPELEYAFVKVGAETYIIADALVETVAQKAGFASYEITDKKLGRELERQTAIHPLYGRDSLIILGNHVTTETGTGCVHTAPGFGADDFEVCRKYKIDIIVPVDQRGIMTDEAGAYAGQHYSKANAAILADLQSSGALLASERITHSYPHCWRCKNPIIFRAAEQWFASVDAIKDLACEQTQSVYFTPEWGRDRMVSMIRERSDWCISRQRHWGLPIPVFYCDDCGKPICNAATTDAVAELFGTRGSNAWFELEAADILPQNFTCPHCGGTHFTKETDTLDGWFDSGSSHAAVLQNSAQFPQLTYPADVYLEGPDQYRGWYQSSMLTSIATQGIAPYKIVVTHGWTVDGQGRAMHKSAGNAVAPDEVINEYGADILRLWVASSDFRADVRISKDILKQLSDIYLKIRNTARYILGNLNDFDPNSLTPFADMQPLDRWAVSRLNALVKRVRDAYERYEYHTIFHGIHDFCAVEMSNFYLDVIKDRLYCDARDSQSGKSARTAIFTILDALVRMLAPILAFTPEEIWAAMPHESGANTESVMLNDLPDYSAAHELTAEETANWDKLLTLRNLVNKELELARADKKIGKSLEAVVTIPEKHKSDADLAALFIVSAVHYADTDAITVEPSTAPKCPRCWNHSEETDENGLCPRCRAEVRG